MTEPVLVFVNERAVRVPPGATAEDAVAAMEPALAERLRAGAAYLTDGRGIRLPPGEAVHAGTIVRHGARPMVTPELIARLPKAELHTHLDGCLRPATMLELARPAKVELPAKDAASLGRYMVANDARNLEDYLKRFDITVALLQTPEAIERVAYEMVEDAAKDHLRYLEVRYCPHLSTHGGLTMDEVVAAEARGFRRGEAEFGVKTGIINCSLRHYTPERSVEVAECSVRCKPLGVVA
ncbi:MAG: hypothetical protein DMD43_06925, partial [Gemmatimonadetes bacterium]